MVWAISLAVCMRKISSGGLLLSHSNEHLCISHEVTSITYAFIPLEKLPREEHIKFDMIFPLLPALRSQTTLTSAGKITLYFLGSFKRERFHFRYNPGHLRKDLWLLFVRECFSFWLKLLLFFFLYRSGFSICSVLCSWWGTKGHNPLKNDIFISTSPLHRYVWK